MPDVWSGRCSDLVITAEYESAVHLFPGMVCLILSKLVEAFHLPETTAQSCSTCYCSIHATVVLQAPIS